MPRARHNQNIRQTAAANEYEGSGCLPVFILPPLIVLFVGLLLAFFAANIPAQATTLQMANAELAPFFTPEVDYWAAAISRWANASNLDPNLVAVIMQIESCGNPSARSSAGAMGLFQVMPFHFFITDNPYDPDTNAARGLAYLKRALNAAKNDVRLALAGYNGGIGVITSVELNWPAETVRYVYYGSGIYEDARAGQPRSSRLDEWYSRYGAGLCNQARQYQTAR
ncbi:MAG: transglycosylase SLT domain-containing protein [Chloroflexi bacterium]|nr:transglycosylase SLT domain-containing protein [Chloroflexota bacterium]